MLGYRKVWVTALKIREKILHRHVPLVITPSQSESFKPPAEIRTIMPPLENSYPSMRIDAVKFHLMAIRAAVTAHPPNMPFRHALKTCSSSLEPTRRWTRQPLC